MTATLDDGKFYSFYLSGIYDADGEEGRRVRRRGRDPGAIDSDQAYVRFVNAISNSQPMTLYAKSTATGSEVADRRDRGVQGGGRVQGGSGGVYDLTSRCGIGART